MKYICIKSFESIRGVVYRKEQIISELSYNNLIFKEQRNFKQHIELNTDDHHYKDAWE